VFLGGERVVRETPMLKSQMRKLARAGAHALAVSALTLMSMNLRAQESRKAISHPAPDYPEIAKKHSIEGSVKIQIVVAPDGHVKETKVLGGHPLLASSVENTVKTWKYVPGPSETTMTLEFNFHP